MPVSRSAIVSTMQDHYQLTINGILRHGSTVHGRSECVTWQGDRARRASYAEIARNAERLAAGLRRLGVAPGDGVATFAWNNQEHVEAYYAVPCMGAVLHTVNIRLTIAQIAQVINHAQDRVAIVDASLLPVFAPALAQLTTVETVIVVGGRDEPLLSRGVRVVRYEHLLAAEQAGFRWPELEETRPALICYTSGTTGDPKGVVYSHRSTYLHALASQAASLTGTTDRDSILTFVPMFHVNAWGIPFMAFMTGASLHMPDRYMNAEQICGFIQAERSTMASAVPTIWQKILHHGRTTPVDLSSLRLGTSGGAAVPRSLLDAFDREYGLELVQGWGMTETSPVCGLARPPAGVSPDREEQLNWRTKSARITAGVEARIVDDAGRELPWDGIAVGEIEVRGPWITGAYHRDPAPEKFRDGWLRTGDLGTIDDRGYLQITDRLKDVIKSGGEWISSVEIENLLAGHPDVREAAVIAVPDEEWTERPLACVVLNDGAAPDPARLSEYLRGKLAGWQVPGQWTFLDEVPKTTVGKYDKKALRGRLDSGELIIEQFRTRRGQRQG